MIRVRSKILFCLSGVGLLYAGACLSAAGMPPDVYRVTDDVLVKDPPRFAVNVDFGSGYAPWDVDRTLNIWNRMVSAEPFQFQHNGIADGGGVDFLEHKNMPSLSYWDCARSGFWDGATMDIYRVVDGRLSLIRRATVSRSLIGNDEKGVRSEERAYFTEKGPAVQAGDLYVLRMKRDTMPSQMRPNLLPKDGVPQFDAIVARLGNVQWSVDSSTCAPEGGSTASLKLVCKEGTASRPASMWQWYMVSNQTDASFFPDKAYRLQIWLKQAGVENGAIKIQVGTITNFTLQADSAWKKFEVDLPVHHPQAPYQLRQGDASRLMVGVAGEGTVWVDNFAIYQTDTPLFSVLPEYKKILKEWHPQVIRVWGGYSAVSLDAWVFKGFRQPSRAGIRGTGSPSYASLDVELQLCLDAGADPWLVLNPLFADEDLVGLMEYLGGPADRGYGKLRAEQGRREPWTTAFRTISLECGNEGWNGIFSPRAWPGNPAFYAKIADRLFSGLKQSPYYRRDQFEFVANGWDSSLEVGGWTHQVAAESKEANRVDIAMYFGGWEKGLGGDGGENEVYQDRLLATPIEYGPKLINALLMDPDLFSRLGAALQARPALAVAALSDYKPRNSVSLAPTGTTATARLEGIMADNEVRRLALIKAMRGFRGAIEKPAWDIGRTVLATHPAFKPVAGELLGMEPELAGRLILAFNNLGGAPGEMTALIRKNPAAVEGLIKALPFSDSEAKTLRGVATGGQLDYFVVNKIGKSASDRVAGFVADANPEFLKAMEAALTPESVRGGVTIAACEATGGLSDSCELYTGGLLQGIKADPEFAQVACGTFAARPDLFAGPASRMTEGIAEGIEKAFAEPFEVTPWGPKILMFQKLPPSLVKRLSELAIKVSGSPDMGISPEARLVVQASFRMGMGEGAHARALAGNSTLSKALESKMQSTILAAFLKAAGADARIGDPLLRAIQRIPAGPTTKGLAIYEAGPGYSLPGPGKPLNEDDENMGKSLASGTATLDAFMLALAQGASPLGYYNFKSGAYWSSHKHPLDLVPYPTWLALELRNRYAEGDLMGVEPESVQMVDVADKKVMATTNDGKGSAKLVKGRKGIAMTACYAFRQGGRHSFLIINRDFANARPVQLKLPYQPSGAATLYTLTHPDPKAHNRQDYNVKIHEQALPGFKDGFVVAVPPASVYLIVN